MPTDMEEGMERVICTVSSGVEVCVGGMGVSKKGCFNVRTVKGGNLRHQLPEAVYEQTEKTHLTREAMKDALSPRTVLR